MSKAKPFILIVEDDKDLAAMLADQLESTGMYTQVYHQASLAIRFLKKNFANLMLLDLHLPDATGFEVIEQLKKNNIKIPVIFVTASDDEVHKVKGLNLGGDDYVTKPFSFPELHARIKAVLRRSETAQDLQLTESIKLTEKPFYFCGAEVNPTSMQIVFPNNVRHNIGKKELGILIMFATKPGQVLTRRSLIHAVWGIHADVRSRSLDQYIVKIRNLFQENGCEIKGLRTIHGVGYSYEPQQA